MEQDEKEALTYLALTRPGALLGAFAVRRVIQAGRDGQSITLSAEEAREIEAFIEFTRATIQEIEDERVAAVAANG